MRRRIWEEDQRQSDTADVALEQSDDDSPAQKSNFNKLVLESDNSTARTRRMRWLSQICEYWPLQRLAATSESDIDNLLHSYADSKSPVKSSFNSTLTNGTVPSTPRPKPLIVLAGSGPGSPSLLTLATHHAIQTADVILADKLVPSAVLDLIPRRTPVHIARKFPGNADAAQQELLEMGLHALKQGQTVLRLKQGDPYIYGRGGEEYVFFREHGYIPVVLPGITSSLSAPLFAAIPPTQRGVADQVLICTGTGRKGAAPDPPRYIKTQTAVFLMALHRLEALVGSLTGGLPNETTNGEAANPDPWPIETPCAVIERASCPDQRVIRSTLEHVVAAVEEEGSRPPGLLVVGWSCEVLMGRRGEKWVTEDGFQGFEELMGRGRAGWEILATVESNGVHDMEVAVDKELQVPMSTSGG
jgi:uroporphyrin-III C-methyltransferase